jgi:hypothetical protein
MQVRVVKLYWQLHGIAVHATPLLHVLGTPSTVHVHSPQQCPTSATRHQPTPTCITRM